MPASDRPAWWQPSSFWLRAGGPALFWLAFLLNLALIAGRIEDFPFQDEWDYVRVEALGPLPAPSFLFHQHSDHFMVTTHIQTWALYHLAGWNLATGAILNYLFVFSLIPLLLVQIGHVQLGRRTWILWLVLLSLLTPFSPYHQFGLLMVGIEHYLVFFLASIVLLFDRDQRTWRLALGSFCAVAATSSVGAGAVSSAITLGLLGIYKAVRIRRGELRRRELGQWLLAAAIIAPAVIAWFIGHHTVPGRPPLTPPWTPEFWRFLFALCALAVGHPGSVAIGATLVTLAALPVLLTMRELGAPRESAWMRLTLVASVLTGSLAVAAARAGFGFERVVTTWHYHGLVELLVPAAFLGWCALRDGRHIGWTASLFGAALLAVSWPTFDTRTLDARVELVREGRRCVVERLARGLPVDCPTAFHSRLDARIQLAEQRGLSFYPRLAKDVAQLRLAHLWTGKRAYRAGELIDFRPHGNATRYQTVGWSGAEPWATWTLGGEARLELSIEEPPALEMRAFVTPFLVPTRPTQQVEVLANGTAVATWSFSPGDGRGTERRASIPAAIARERTPLELAFRIEDPRAPSDHGGNDTRRLGIAFATLSLEASIRR